MKKSGTEWTFTYDANGMRTKRTDGTTVCTYAYNGSQLSWMIYSGTTFGSIMRFTYSADGRPLSVDCGSIYYYVTNLQGDVVGILDSDGNQVVGYTYDAWGRLLSTTGSMASTLGLCNPLRYRGYVYDTETGLYYLQSRYYNPTIGRFINADTYASTGQSLVGHNMFAYCNNNPVMYSDPTGHFGLVGAIIVTGAIVGGLLGAFSAATTGGNVLESAIEGCLTGALGAACGILISNPIVAVGLATVGGAAIDFATQITTQCIENESVDLSKIDCGRIVKTGLQTGIGTAIPVFGEGAGNAVDAFGTALLWAEASTIIVCIDVFVTNAIAGFQSTVRRALTN